MDGNLLREVACAMPECTFLWQPAPSDAYVDVGIDDKGMKKSQKTVPAPPFDITCSDDCVQP